MKIKRRYSARKDTIQEIRSDLEKVSSEFLKLLGDKIEVAETDEGTTFILINGEAVIFKSKKGYFPTIKGALNIKLERRFITVDKGAVPFVAGGADVMRPGVVDFDENIKKGDLVIINEENYKRPLAIGISLWEGRDFKDKKNGKCVERLLYIGDDFWNLKA